MSDADSRFCSNCRAELPRDADACPACGVYAGDVFDGTWPPRKKHTRLWLILLVLAVIAAAAAVWLARTGGLPDAAGPKTPSTRVVADRPGGARRSPGARMTEAEAVRLLRRHLVETKDIANDCITLIGDRAAGDYVFRAFDRCAEARLGRWRVDPSSGEASLHSTAAAP